MSHLWQRFLLGSALLVGIAVGAGATLFGFDNTTRVDVYWAAFHIHAVPVWAVAVVPVTLVLVLGTVFHWLNGLHHFTEHMRHRRRVHELEAELATLRAHLDQVLEMPTASSNKPAPRQESPAVVPDANGGLDKVMAGELEPPAAEADPPVAEAEPAVEALPAAANNSTKSRKRVTLELGDHKPAENEASETES